MVGSAAGLRNGANFRDIAFCPGERLRIFLFFFIRLVRGQALVCYCEFALGSRWNSAGRGSVTRFDLGGFAIVRLLID